MHCIFFVKMHVSTYKHTSYVSIPLLQHCMEPKNYKFHSIQLKPKTKIKNHISEYFSPPGIVSKCILYRATVPILAKINTGKLILSAVQTNTPQRLARNISETYFTRKSKHLSKCI